MKALALRSQARPSPQPGQTNPSGHRRANRYSAQALSVAETILEFDQRLGKPARGSRHDLTLLILDGQ